MFLLCLMHSQQTNEILKQNKDVGMGLWMGLYLGVGIFLFPFFFMPWHPYIPLHFIEMIFPLVYIRMRGSRGQHARKAGGWMLAEPRLLSCARGWARGWRRTRQSASMQRVTKQQRQARRRWSWNIVCRSPRQTKGLGLSKSMCSSWLNMLFTARGISAHFAYIYYYI